MRIMSWTWTPPARERPQETVPQGAEEILARALASAAGEDWDALHNHPGFERGRWRAMARELVRTVAR